MLDNDCYIYYVASIYVMQLDFMINPSLVYSPFSGRVGLPPHNISIQGVMKRIGSAFLQQEALQEINNRRGKQYQIVLNKTL